MKTFLVSLLVFAATAVLAADSRMKAGVFEPPRMAPDFTLQGSDGHELRLSRYRGKVVALEFGFTNCQFVCPTTLAALANARKKLGASGHDLQVVYITVDPERDSPERLRSYLANFDPTFIGATGTAKELASSRWEYGIAAARKAGGDPDHYDVDHSSFVYLIDRNGRLRALVPYGRSADDIAHDVAILLKQ